MAPPAPTLSGRVTGPGDTPLADVRITVGEGRRSATTGPDGRYTIANLPTGTYSIAFALVGYAPEVRRVTLGAADVELNVELRPSAVELPEVQITATPLATTPLTSPQPTAVLGDAALRVAQAPSLGETLSGVAGVHSLSTGVGIGKPVIRGLTANRVLVLDNGVRVEDQQWGDEHSPNVETAGADRIEVIRGPASVLYGSDALGGVINVVPRELPDAQGRAPFVTGKVSAAYTSNNREPDATLLAEAASGGVGGRVTLTGRASSDVRTPDYILWNSGNRAAGGSGAVGYHGTWGSLSGAYTQRNERISLTG
ncbi:MAG TPA: TonB-dependent receptor, partial [Gemmatimonadales bacterium]|nr:TonB-dependent receptor [Gemmatimonadales bacterium]